MNNSTNSFANRFHINTKTLARQAFFAAVYVILTVSGWGVSYGLVQFRYSEIMNWLAFFDPKNVIGLTVGCFISNIWSPFGLIDMFVGTLGTLLATLCMAHTRRALVAAIWPAVFSFLYSGEALLLGQITLGLFVPVTLQIMLSEILIVGVIGIPIMLIVTRSNAIRSLLVDPASPTKMDRTGVQPFPFQL